MALKAILFDKDGTFVDFSATWGPAIDYAMRSMSAGDEEAYQRLCAANLFDPATRTLNGASPFIAEASADFASRWAAALRVPFSRDFHRRMDSLLDQGGLANVTPIGDPGHVFSTLKKDGYALAIVTNDSERGARLQSEKLGILHHFDAVLGYDSGHGRKPAPEPVLACAARFGLAPQEVAMVGDTLHDLHAGRAAGAVTIAVTSGFAGADILGPHADHVLADIMALPALLNSLAPLAGRGRG